HASRLCFPPAPATTYISTLSLHDALPISRDHSPETIAAAMARARRTGQAVAVPAGEAGREDIESALALQPDFLVHMNRAEDADLRQVASRGISVVVCPRSNLMTGVGLPPVAATTRPGIHLAA